MRVSRPIFALVIVMEIAGLTGYAFWLKAQPARETIVAFVRMPPPFSRPDEVGARVGSTNGLTMFRGNPTRTFYGSGPVPAAPVILWKYPAGRQLCAVSYVGRQASTWCGSGWTGQPAVIDRTGGPEVIVGTYDRRVHFINGLTGRPSRTPFATGDIIKGSVTVDPDGFPLLYSGSRDNFFHIIALDRDRPTELWRLSAGDAPNPMWNDDWDGNAVIVDDYLFEGGENSWFYIVKLNRGYDAAGRVTVAPQVVVRFPGFDEELLRDLGDRDVSIENSPVLFGWTVFFSNSGGLVSGLDLRRLREQPDSVRRTFRFWGGDDVNGTIVADERGMLYVAAEEQRRNARASRVGHLYSLNPRSSEPLRWSLRVPRGRDGHGGIYSTPALFGETIYITTHAGALMAVGRDDGRVRWQYPLPPHAWSSPVVVDSTLIVADCEGRIRAFDVRDQTRRPPLLWEFRLPSGACIESTPAVWNGRIYVGARDGYIYGIGDR